MLQAVPCATPVLGHARIATIASRFRFASQLISGDCDEWAFSKCIAMHAVVCTMLQFVTSDTVLRTGWRAHCSQALTRKLLAERTSQLHFAASVSALHAWCQFSSMTWVVGKQLNTTTWHRMAVAGFVITCSSCRVLSTSFLNDDPHAGRVCVDCLHQTMQAIQKEKHGTLVVCCTSARMARDHCGNTKCGRVCPQYGSPVWQVPP